MVFQIRQVRSYKGHTFCLSVFKGNAYWSTHKGVFDINQAKRNVQRSHDQQVNSLIQENAKPLTIQN